MIVVAAVFVPSATEVAVTVTVAGVGTALGAEYVTGAPLALLDGDTVPQAAPLQPAPDTIQLTPLFAESFVTVAVSACVCPTCTVIVAGATLTAMAAAGGVGLPPDELGETVPAQPEMNRIRTRMETKIGRAPAHLRFTVVVLP